MKYREGLVPAIEFDDVSVVTRTGQQTCLAGTCYKQVLVVDETSPNDPTSGHQIKYYSPPTGLIQVAARGGDSQEFLTLTSVRHLGAADMAKVRSEVLAMDQRAYKIKVYRTTKPAQQRRDERGGPSHDHGVRRPGRAGTRSRPAGRGRVSRSWRAGG